MDAKKKPAKPKSKKDITLKVNGSVDDVLKASFSHDPKRKEEEKN